MRALMLIAACACTTADPTALQRAREAAPLAEVAPSDVSWPGYEVFVAAQGNARVGLVVSADGEVLGGRNAAVQLAPSADDDPLAAARLLNLLADPDADARGARVLTASDPAEPLSAAPAIEGETLTYWRESPRHGGLARCRVRLQPLDQIRCVPASAARAEAATPSDALARPRELLRSEQENDRVQGVELAAVVDGPLAAELLLDVARQDPSARLRQKAVKLLGARNHPLAVPTIANLLRQDPDPETRMEAARTLGRWKARGTAPELRAAAQEDPDERVRATASNVLRGMR
jgi:hypothetical protein